MTLVITRLFLLLIVNYTIVNKFYFIFFIICYQLHTVNHTKLMPMPCLKPRKLTRATYP
jgi:hypothetical protein